ncbi:MAG: FliO/MopB family protein [Phycisphaerae bacterium]
MTRAAAPDVRWRVVVGILRGTLAAIAVLAPAGRVEGALADPPADELRMFPDDAAGVATPAATPLSVAPRAEHAASSERGREPLARHAGRPGRMPTATSDGAPRESTSWVRTSAALAGVVALIVLLGWGYRAAAGAATRWPLALRARNHGVLELVARMPVAPRQSVCLLRVGPRLVLLGVGGDGLRSLDVIDDADTAARLLAQARGAAPESSADFQRALQAEARAETTEPHRRRGAVDPGASEAESGVETPSVAAVRDSLLGTIDRVRARHVSV